MCYSAAREPLTLPACLPQAGGCRALAEDVLALLEQAAQLRGAGGSAQQLGRVERELQLKGSTLARECAARRQFVAPAADGGAGGAAYEYDPRFLVFEFIGGFMLREQQVELVRRFASAAKGGRSLCHQMIMGAGKTTVIAPMLDLLLADGKTLVVQCVPKALLQMSRSVVRTVFGAVVPKAVFTFAFERHSAVTPALLRKLTLARDSRAVVVATPSAIKSFAVKFVELLNELAALGRAGREQRARERGQGGMAALKGKMSSGLTGMLSAVKSKFTGEEDAGEGRAQAEGRLRAQAETCAGVLALFRAGALLLDEVGVQLLVLGCCCWCCCCCCWCCCCWCCCCCSCCCCCCCCCCC